MAFDRTRIRQGELIAAIGAIALLIVSFLDWYTFKGSIRLHYLVLASGRPEPLTGNAWHVFSNTSLLMAVFMLLAVALAGVRATQRRVEFPLAGVTVGLGVLLVVLMIDKLFVSRPGGNKYTQTAIGGYLGLVLIVVITVGGGLSARADGMSWRRSDVPPGSAD